MAKGRLLDKFLELVYPDALYCNCCGKVIDWSRPYGLCDTCMRSIRWATGRLCDRCGKILSQSNPGETCFNCRANPHSFSHGYTCTEYNVQTRAMVYNLKYNNNPAVARSLGSILADRMLQDFTSSELAETYDLLVPVPISAERRLQRGYNRAALICEYFADAARLPYCGEVLERVEETRAMKGLTPPERRRNMKNCFDIRPGFRDRIDGAVCLIIDDIVTTGATADEIAALLLASGAARADILSFASGADVIKS